MIQNQNFDTDEQSNAAGSFFSWEEIPDIGLYMDQVVNVLNQRLDESRRITPNMINNYVKEGYLEPPVQRRYSRAQILRLYLMLLLKPVLMVPDIAVLLDGLARSLPEGYKAVCEEMELYAGELKGLLSDYSGDGKSGDQAALLLALKASALRQVAESLISRVSDHRPKSEVE